MINFKQRFLLYLCEALGLGIFMISAGGFDVLIDHPDLPIRQAISSDILRRFLIGLSMGLTAFFIIKSPFGKKSGAHINPSVTLVQYQLGNIGWQDALFYALFQFIGGSLGMGLVCYLLPDFIRHPAINFIITVPQKDGIGLAFLLEFLISMGLILTVLFTSNSEKWTRFTPYFVATIITFYITFEAPYSGMSMNPARTFASAIVASQWTSFWLYCTAPILGMLTGKYLFLKFKSKK